MNSKRFETEMIDLIKDKFILDNDETERLDGYRPNENIYFQTLRKIVFPIENCMPRLVEIFIVRYTLIKPDKMIIEKIWGYLTGYDIDGEQIKFRDYSKSTDTKTNSIDYFFKKV